MKAFPNISYISSGNGYKYSETGMDLRDYFAAAIAPTLLQGFTWNEVCKDSDEMARACYAMADAMMEARNV